MKLEWLFNLKGNVAQQLGAAANEFRKTNAEAMAFRKSLGEMPKSLEQIRKRIDDLKVIRDLTGDMKELARANREIQALEGRAKSMASAGLGRGNRIQNFLTGGPLSQLPGVAGLAGMATPAGLAAAGVAAAGTALVQGTRQAMSFEAGMAKANVTMGLSRAELAGLSQEVMGLARGSGIENALGQVPDAFNQIISGVGDKALGLDILRNSLRGAEAAQADLRVVGDAVVNTLNSVGPANTTAKEALDTLFGAVNKGKGEFVDFANYLPKIIPLSNNLGLSFKETAGAFAFYTSQGLRAEQASTTLENVFKALADTKRQKEFRKLGVELFDQQGKLRSLVDISGQLRKRFDGLTNEQRVRVLDAIGLDQEATLGLSMFVQDTAKLKNTIDDVRNSAARGIGLEGALANGQNKQAEWNRLMNDFDATLTRLGTRTLPVFTAAMKAVNTGLDWIGSVRGFLNAGNISAKDSWVDSTADWIRGALGLGPEPGMATNTPALPRGKTPVQAVNDIMNAPLFGPTGRGDGSLLRRPGGAEPKKSIDPFAKKRLNELDKKEREATEKVTGGGSRPVNIHIKLDALNQGGITIQTTNLSEGASQVETQLQQMLLRILNSANQIAMN
jgi:TP901 family phage tail tape measure protein